MSIFAWTRSHADMDMQPCRHADMDMQPCSHADCRDADMSAEIRACRHAGMGMRHAKIRAWTCRHASLDMHVDMQRCSHGDMNMQTWTCKFADTGRQTCRTCRRGYAGMTCDLEVGMAGTSKVAQKMDATGTFGHANTDPHAFRHGHANMDVLQRCSHGEMDMERWI